ncbi:hypothetical protein E1B28_011386 [Marasmius oreades]|uniref:Uncharacterized protein n=1 Tax=Marasmius oreades TaxID=181124 RepID=A0A9P7UPI4_9AGAR|nr:uncharacterized protein E1B28_011386 [Marasmius oreades]KAG7089732.1 hypothetical protein E1B28_011386 [Marasmius oreades]
MSLLEVAISNLVRYPARTRDHFSQAVETIKLCHEIQCTTNYSNPEQVEQLKAIVQKAEEALQNAINLTKSAPFDEFRDTVIETCSNTNIMHEFDRKLAEAKKRDGRKKRLLEKARSRIQQEDSSEWSIAISFVNPEVKVFNDDDVDSESKTTAIVKCRKNDTVDGLLWLFTRQRSSKLLNNPHLYKPEEFTRFKYATDDVEPISPISHPPQHRCRLRLLWNRDPPFYFTVVLRGPSYSSYGNIWRLNKSTASPFVLKEQNSGKLVLSTNLTSNAEPFNVRSPAEGDIIEVDQNFPTFLEKVLQDPTKARPNWKFESVSVPPSFPVPVTVTKVGQLGQTATSCTPSTSTPIYPIAHQSPNPTIFVPAVTRQDSEQSYHTTHEHLPTLDVHEESVPLTFPEPSHVNESITFQSEPAPSLLSMPATSQTREPPSASNSGRSGVSVGILEHGVTRNGRAPRTTTPTLQDSAPRAVPESQKGQGHSRSKNRPPISAPSIVHPQLNNKDMGLSSTNGTSLSNDKSPPSDASRSSTLKNVAPKKGGFGAWVKGIFGLNTK